MNRIKFIVLVFIVLHSFSLQADVTSYFNQIKKNPNALYAFFRTMPKGGELHYHLAGGTYAENMLELATKGEYCLDTETFAVNKNTLHCDGVKIKDIASQSELYSQIIKDWSMKDFVPGKESGHDHFFKGFIKYMPIIFDYRPQLLADVIQRASQQHEQYLEIMTIPDNARSTQFGDLIKNTLSYAKRKQVLLANKEFQTNIANTISESDRILEQARVELGCLIHSKTDSCTIKIKFLYYVLREQPPNNFFAQTLNAFEAVSRSKGNLVGVNLVQAEDGTIALCDYRKQMAVFKYFHHIYPQVKVSLHAGELSPKLVASKELRYHIYDALFTGNALRIGHGVDITYEHDAQAILNYMASHHVPVEVNLISNQKILNISGRNHPLNYYLSHQVPVVLSTDDEGILRTDLTRQYVEAVLGQGLDYKRLKQINRNTLTYAFLPGESLWVDTNKSLLVEECQDLNSKTCKKFIGNNEKAQLQWNLEQKLIAFEGNF